MNVSLNLGGSAKRARASVNVHGEAETQTKEQLREFSGKEGQAREKKKPRVIPSQPNTSKAPESRQKDPTKLGELTDKFEAAIAPVASDTTYGLVQRGGDTKASARKGKAAQAADKADFHTDIGQLPEAPQEEAYDAMPVEDFGRALLMGMGATNETATAPVEYIARPSRMGLGVKAGDVVTAGKRNYKQLVDEAGNTKSIRREGDKLIDVATLGARVGKTMSVGAGRHRGLQCVVRELDVDGDKGRVRVRLMPCETDVVLSADILAEPGAPVVDKQRRKEKESDPESGPPQRQRQPSAHESAKERAAEKGTREGDADAREGAGRTSRTWLCENIRVRVVDKDVGRGKLYLQKGIVICIPAPGLCDVRMDGGGQVQEGLAEGQVETVVPKAKGSLIMVLRGEHKGRHARLLEKRSEVVALQLTESMHIVKASLDDVAEYVGHAEGEDY